MNKELILILNNNKLSIEEWEKKVSNIENLRIFQLDESISLGKCLNFGIEKSKFQIIAKFDDDDYYGPLYLQDSIQAFTYTKASVIGKATTYVYFLEKKLLALRTPKRENSYCSRVEGPTLIFKKEVFDKIKFRDKSFGEDIQFCTDCVKKGIKIYSHNPYNYLYFRRNSSHKHSWKISDNDLLKFCRVIGNVENFEDYINK